MAEKNLRMEQFVAEVKAEMERRFSNAKVITKKITKNNSKVLTGIIINEGVNVTPTIYLDDYFNLYENKEMSMEEVTDTISELYTQNKMSVDININWLFNFAEVEDKIVFNLVNAERNTELLATVPHIDLLDLAYIFKVMVSNEDDATATITITDKLADEWGKSADELMEVAKYNQEKLYGGLKIENITDMLYEMQGKAIGMSRDEFVEMLGGELPLVVVTNQKMLNGGYCAFDKRVLKTYSEIGDVAILPSSIHEGIIIPYEIAGMNLDDLVGMPMAVNATEVAPEEVLSDNVYVYHHDTDEITIVE